MGKRLKGNLSKMQFKASAVEYMAKIVAAEELQPDKRKLEAIIDAPTLLMLRLCYGFMD